MSCNGLLVSGEAEAKPPKVSRPSSDSEVEIVGVQENPRYTDTEMKCVTLETLMRNKNKN